MTDKPTKPKIVELMAERLNVDPTKLVPLLKATCFKTDKPISDEQVMWLLIICNEYNLNPLLKQIYAYIDWQNGGAVIPVVGVDGWLRIMNEHPQFEGIDLSESEKMVEGEGHPPAPEWAQAVIHRKDRPAHPVTIRERFLECYKPNAAGKKGNHWQTHPSRATRHKAIIQCCRVAFNFSNIYDEDEARRIVEVDVTTRGEAQVMGAEGLAGRITRAQAPALNAPGQTESEKEIRGDEPVITPFETILETIGTAENDAQLSALIAEARAAYKEEPARKMVMAAASKRLIELSAKASTA